MRLTSVVPLVLIAVATGCSQQQPPREPQSTPAAPPAQAAVAATPGTPHDLKINIALVVAGKNEKCVVSFLDPDFKKAEVAIAYTNHSVIWQVQTNGCGEQKAKVGGKALGLRHLKLGKTGAPAAWVDRCSKLHLIPAAIETPLQFRCEIPSVKDGDWQDDENERVYEYEIDGDSVEPLDPDIGVRRNG